MTLLRRFSISVASNWTARAVQMVTGLLLVPILLSRLGRDAYGVWVILGSFLAYVALLDAGLTVAVRRFTARYAALKSLEDQSGMMSTAIVFYTAAAMLAAAITLLAAPFVPVVLERIPESLHTDTVALFHIAGAMAFLRLFLLPLRGFVEGHLRYEVANVSVVVNRLLYFALAVLLLRTFAPSVRWVGFAAICGMAVELTILAVACFRLVPELRISLRRFSTSHLKSLSGFGINTFILAICGLLIYQAPNFIIMKWIGPGATAVFAVATAAIVMVRQGANSLGAVFVPVFSASHALQNRQQIEDRLWKGSQACNLLNWTLCVGLMIYAQPALQQWIRKDPDLAHAAYWPLIILTVGQLPQGLSYVANSALAGCGHLKWLVITQIAVAVSCVVLGITAVLRGYGVQGVTLAMVVPHFVRQSVWMPWYVSHKLAVPLWRFIAKAYLRPVCAAAIVGAACFALRAVYPVSSRVGLLVSLAIMGAVALIAGLGVGLSPEIRRRLTAPVLRRLGRKA